MAQLVWQFLKYLIIVNHYLIIIQSNNKNIFQVASKGCTINWNRKSFKIHKIKDSSPVTFVLGDENT